MQGEKLCLGIIEELGHAEELIRLYKRVGFDGFFVDWAEGLDLLRLRAVAEEEGMIFQSVHAPFGRMRDMWHGDEAQATAAVAELLRCLEETAAARVPLMVCHAFIGFHDHTPTRHGLDNYAIVVKRAEEAGVKIAFENTEGEEYLAALMEHFAASRAVGFCWDTGHEMCYNGGKDMLSLYGDRLLGTHINDNLGIKDYHGGITFLDDLHLLPFDGIGDWKGVAARLNRHNYKGELTFELLTKSKPNRHENDVYDRMTPQDYLTEAFKRACRVASLKRRQTT